MRRRIAYLFQGAALFDSLSVGENVAYGLREQFWNTMTDAEIRRPRRAVARASSAFRASRPCARAISPAA